MRTDFKRLGVMGQWAEPYLTMNYGYQSAIVRSLHRFVEQGMVYKGKKPVHWCIHCRTALAEAEVEYDNHESPSIYVEFPFSAESQAEFATRVHELAGRQLSILIWDDDAVDDSVESRDPRSIRTSCTAPMLLVTPRSSWPRVWPSRCRLG